MHHGIFRRRRGQHTDVGKQHFLHVFIGNAGLFKAVELLELTYGRLRRLAENTVGRAVQKAQLNQPVLQKNYVSRAVRLIAVAQLKHLIGRHRRGVIFTVHVGFNRRILIRRRGRRCFRRRRLGHGRRGRGHIAEQQIAGGHALGKRRRVHCRCHNTNQHRAENTTKHDRNTPHIESFVSIHTGFIIPDFTVESTAFSAHFC